MNGIVYPYGSSHLINDDCQLRYVVNLQDKVSIPESSKYPAETLIQLSGGIDSTFVLYSWLKNNPDKYCLVHHVVIENTYEKRQHKELQSVDKILKWLDSKGLDNYFYIQNTFDYGNFPDLISDVEICGFLSAVLLRAKRWESISNITMSIFNQKSEREIRRQQIVKATSKREITLNYVLSGLKKSDVINSLPKELFELCWWCRAPINELPCGRCFTCESVKSAFKEIENNKLKDFLTGL
jgi:7-cyano-7-deazaguanine synthase in queuosine biosynthesis